MANSQLDPCIDCGAEDDGIIVVRVKCYPSSHDEMKIQSCAGYCPSCWEKHKRSKHAKKLKASMEAVRDELISMNAVKFKKLFEDHKDGAVVKAFREISEFFDAAKAPNEKKRS